MHFVGVLWILASFCWIGIYALSAYEREQYLWDLLLKMNETQTRVIDNLTKVIDNQSVLGESQGALATFHKLHIERQNRIATADQLEAPLTSRN